MEQENKSKSSSEKVDDKLSLSSSSSLKSSKKQKSSKAQLESEDISLSQLELMANKKKIKSIEDISIISKKSPTVKRQQEEDFLKKSVKSSKSSSSSSSSSDDSKQKRRKEKLVSRENQNDAIRKEKSEFLYKFNKLNVKGKWSSLRLDMNCTLDEIRNEFERIKSEISSERNVAFFKRMLLLGVQGIEMLNTKFDPVGVDLDGWSEAMGYSMENQEYDEVMAELYEKYKGKGQMSPEMRLIFMIISSATMFTISKKITKMDSGSPFKSFIGGLMSNQQQPKTTYVPSANDLRNDNISETSDDNMPSRINGPNSQYINGNEIDINNILKTMNDRKLEKQQQSEDDIFKNIPMNKTKRKGRPRKTNNSIRMQ